MRKTISCFIMAVLFFSQVNIVSAESFEWTQTTQADFDAGEKVNVNTLSSPSDVLLGPDVDKLTIAAGDYHTVGLKEDGTAVAVGLNWWGQANVDDWSSIRQPSYAHKYSSFGTLTSSIFDTQNVSYFETISWNATIPDEAGIGAVKFQIVTSNNTKLTNKFFGPDGTSDTYYTTSGQTIWQGHNGDRYIRYKLYLTTANPNFTPTLHDVTISYKSGSV